MISSSVNAWRQRITYGGYHRWQNRQARLAYMRIVAAWPDRGLDDVIRKRIREYAGDQFGHTLFAPWLFTYAAWRGRFVEGCLPDTYHGIYVVQNIKRRASLLQDPSALQGRIGEEALPSLGFVRKGKIFSADGTLKDTGSFIKEVFKDYPDIYLKNAKVQQGRGVRRLNREGFATAIQNCREGVVQAPIPIHDDLQTFSPDAAATLRITSVYVPPAPPRVIAAFLRLGRTGDSHVKASSQVKVSVQPDGELFSIGALADWTPTERHPDTGIAFSAFEVPSYQMAVTYVEKLHLRLPEASYVGWDVAIKPDGTPQLFEANIGHAGITFSEANHGPIFDGLGWDRLHKST